MTQFTDDPSPRAWGSPSTAASTRRHPRSIPTCVGLTRGVRSPASQPGGPSPRAWGSPRALTTAVELRGPSPRAWGSLRSRRATSALRSRSIPTCVGLTHQRPSAADERRSIPTCVGLTSSARLYHGARGPSPRAWGSPAAQRHAPTSDRGPSPRAWGSHAHRAPWTARPRSIPTCVGLTALGARHRSDGGPSPRAWGSP